MKDKLFYFVCTLWAIEAFWFGENFHSFRRDKELSGRNGAIIFMEEWLYEKQINGIFFSFGTSCCGSSGSIELTKQEKEKVNGDVNIARQLLVQKAILKDASTEKIKWRWSIQS